MAKVIGADIDAFCSYLIEEELAANTVVSYVNSVKDFFGKYNEFNKKNIILWKNGLLESNSPKTVNLRISAVEKYAKFLGTNLSVKRVKIQKQNSVENVMTIECFNKLIDSLEEDGKYKYAMYYKILAKTGARVSEFLKFKKRDINNGFAELKTKGKIRRVYFPSSLLREMKDFYKDYNDDDYLCKNRYGGQMTSRGIGQCLKNHAKKYGIPAEMAHPHSFRHLFAIEFLKRNQNISLLADLLGHSGVNTTMIYLRLSQEQQIGELNKAVNW